MTFSKALLPSVVFLIAACSFQKPQDRVRDFSRADSGYVIRSADATIPSGGAVDPQKWTARLVVMVNVCLTRTFGMTEMDPNIPFQVELAETENGTGGGPILMTSPRGCFSFETPIDFPFAQKKVQYLKRYVVVRGQKDELHGVVRSQVVYIDPWNQDVTKDWNNAQAPPVAADSGPQQLRIKDYSLKRGNRASYVDRDLNLSFRYNYKLSFYDGLARLLSTNQKVQDALVWTHTRFAISGILISAPVTEKHPETADLSSFKRLGAFQTVGETNANGQVSVDIAFQLKLQDIPYLDARSYLILDIKPISEGAEAPEPVHMALLFDPRQEQPTLSPDPAPTSAEALIQSAGFEKISVAGRPPTLTDAGQAPWTIFASHYELTKNPLEAMIRQLGLNANLQRMDLDDLQVQSFVGGLSRGEIEDAIGNSTIKPDFLLHFAYLFNNENPFPGLEESSDRARFVKAPDLMTKVARFTVADQVEPEPVEGLADAQTLGKVSNLYIQEMQNKLEGGGNRSGYATEIADARSLGYNSFGNGRTWNWNFAGHVEKYAMREKTTMKSTVQQTGVNDSQSFYADRLRVTLKGQFRDCLALSFVNVTKSFLFCEKRKKDLNESYYYVTDEFRSNVYSFVDYKKLNERVLLKVFRGESVAQGLVQYLRDGNLTVGLVPDNNIDDHSVLPGVSSISVITDPATLEKHFKDAIESLEIALGDNSQIGEDDLVDYFNKVRSSPDEIFGNEELACDFQRMAQINSSPSPQAKTAYLEILSLLQTHFLMKDLHQAADAVYQVAKDPLVRSKSCDKSANGSDQ